jgi:hypothetical protein
MESFSSCSVCYEEFNTDICKPLMLDRCGHSFCKKCIFNFIDMSCPKCRTRFKKTHPNYALIDTLTSTSNVSSDAINYLNTLQNNIDNYSELFSSNMKANEIFLNTNKRINQWVEKENEKIYDYIIKKRQKLNAKEEKLLKNLNERKRSLIKECDELKQKYQSAEYADFLESKTALKTKIERWKNNLFNNKNAKYESSVQDVNIDLRRRKVLLEYKSNLLKEIDQLMINYK